MQINMEEAPPSLLKEMPIRAPRDQGGPTAEGTESHHESTMRLSRRR